MAVTLIQNRVPLTLEDVRLFLRDQPDHNPLLVDGIEFSDDDITRAIHWTVAKYDVLTPVSTSPRSGESLNEYLLLCGVCSILLRSEGVRQLRNQITAQDGNIAPVGLDEKQALYAAWADYFQKEFDFHARQVKTQINMESAFGGFSSGYRYVGRYTV
ncbi:MAG: hypothetical protein DRJ03_07695 [Chloroflexi bacterium]|nr:MAG: hypothetical protein DRJ03_07695 [Chloroflexota bacterium]